MPPKCIMNCKGSKQLFGFPGKADQKQKWCEILGLNSDAVYGSDKICERHFDAKYISGKKLKMYALPEKPSTSKRSYEESPEENNCTEFETIYLSLDGPPKRSFERKTYEKSSTQKKVKIEIKEGEDDDVMQPDDESSKISDVVAACNASFQPVKIAFESPPKRTYAHGVTGKAPQLDITMTCYCRCHKGEEEEHRQLVNTVNTMKKKAVVQSQEIQLLMSQNKISEHLLKTKMKRIADLVLIEQKLRKELEILNSRITEMARRQIKASPNASENSITFARMVCDKRKKYTRAEVLLAQKIYSVSGRCYSFMRGVLMLNLPHTTTLLRQRQLKADSYMAQAVDVGESEFEVDQQPVG